MKGLHVMVNKMALVCTW